MTKINNITFVSKSELGEFSPYTYGEIGELIINYLVGKGGEDIAGIVEVNDCEELWDVDTLVNFKEEFEHGDITTKDLSIGYIGFGTITVNGLTFPAVIEQNASPAIVYINDRTRRIISEVFKNIAKEIV